MAGTFLAYGGAAVTIYDTYKANASPQASLEASGRKLEKIRSRLQGLSPQRREEIEVATQLGTFGNENPKKLAGIENELQECVRWFAPSLSNSNSLRRSLVSQIRFVD